MTDVNVASLGDRSYLAHDGQVAIVVDPQRDIDRIPAPAGRLGVRITHVAETHADRQIVHIDDAPGAGLSIVPGN